MRVLRLLGRLILLGIAAVFLLIAVSAVLVLYAARGVVFDKADELPHHAMGLVLGTSPLGPSGSPNVFFVNRMDAAAAVYHAGRVDQLLLSGNKTEGYDEPAAMRKALVQRGVPADRCVLDGEGFTTFESVLRARDTFGQKSLCIISQRDHASRAVYIAKAAGMDAVAYPAKDVNSGVLHIKIRECLARVRAVLDMHLGRKPPD